MNAHILPLTSEPTFSPRHTIPHLPLEVIEHILDYLTPDSIAQEHVTSLSACTLVCRSWLHRSSLNLLQFVDFTRRKDFCPAFLNIFITATRGSPRLRQHVRTLIVPWRPEDRTITAVLDALPALSGLSFFPEHTIDTDIATDLSPELTRTPQRHTLERFALCHQKGSSVLRSLCLFGRIDHLALLRIDRTDDTEDALLLASAPHLAVRELTLDAHDLPLLAPLARILVPGVLASVSVQDMCCWPGGREYAALHPFLMAVGAGIERLELAVPNVVSSSRWAAGVDLRLGIPLDVCPRLRELRISCRSWQENLPRVCAVFLAALPPSIRRVRLELLVPLSRRAPYRLAFANTALAPVWQLLDRATAPYADLHVVEVVAPFEHGAPPEGFLAGCSARFGRVLRLTRVLD